MAVARALLCAAFARAAALGCRVSGSGANASAARSVGEVRNLLVASDIRVNAEVGNGSSLTVSGFENLLDQLVARTVSNETLLLALLPGTCNSNVVVNLTVPAPLEYIAASLGSEVMVDSVAGSMSASNAGSISARELVSSQPVNLDALAGASINVSEGRVGRLSVSSSARSSVALGELRARRAVITAAAESSVSGMTAAVVMITVSSSSEVATSAILHAAYVCSGASNLTISGRAAITEHWSDDCQVQASGGGPVAATILP